MISQIPDYRIINKTTGSDLTDLLKPFLVSLSLTESSDNQNDTLTVVIDARGINQFPKSGTVLEVFLGYQGFPLPGFGTYKVDTKKITGMPLLLTVKAGATDFTAPLKTQKSRHFEQQTLGEILNTIAKENALEIADLSKQISSKLVPYLRQDQESDMNLINRLADDHSANGTIKGGKIVFKEISEPAKVITITPDDLDKFSFTWIDKPSFDQVIATWHDTHLNQTFSEVYDGNSFVKTEKPSVSRVPGQFQNKIEARKKAKTKWHHLNSLKLKASFSMPGNTNVTSKLGCKLSGFIPEVEGLIVFVTTVTHTISNNFKTSVQATNQSTSSIST